DFDDVEPFFLAQRERLIQADLAILVAVVADQEDGFGIDLVVDARAILGRCGGITLKTSGNYDSLLCTAARIRASPVPLGPRRNEVRSWTQAGAFRGCAGLALRRIPPDS